MNNIIDFSYMGTVTACCSRCDTCYDLKFGGNDDSIEDAMSNAFEGAGWSEGICPSCLKDSDYDGTDE